MPLEKRYILAIAGSFGTTTVAIYSDLDCLAKEVFPSTSCSKLLASKIEELLIKAALVISELACIVTEVGPGSFTGLRILVVTANALGHALKIPVIGMNSLDCLIQQLSTNNDSGLLIPLINAYGGLAYAAIYDLAEQGAIVCDLCVGPEDLVKNINVIPGSKIFIFGQVPAVFQTRLLSALENVGADTCLLSGQLKVEATFVLVKYVLSQLANKSFNRVFSPLVPVYVKSNFGSF